MPVATILFTVLYGILFLWMLGGFFARKIKLFSCFGWLFLLIAMRIAALGLDLAATYTTAKLSYRIGFNILFIESFCFLTVCLYDFLSKYRNKTAVAGAGSRRVFTGVAYFFLSLIAVLLLAAAVMNACASANVVKNPAALSNAASIVNTVSMFFLLFFTVFWIGPLIRTASGKLGMHGVLTLLLLAWICLMVRVGYAIGVVIYNVAGNNNSVKNGLNNGWLWLSLFMDFMATAFMAATYFPGRQLVRQAIIPATYNPYGVPSQSAVVYPGVASISSRNSMEKIPITQHAS